MQRSKLIIENTGILYAKTLVTIGISLVSTRLVLNSLGISDFGLFSLVGSAIAMLAFLNSAMAMSTQRYLSFYLGVNNLTKLRKVFHCSIILHFIISILIVLLLEIVGPYLFENVLNVPQPRLPAATTIYHAMVLSTFFTINVVPYDAAINSHENMLFDALLGIFEAFTKLGIAVSLNYIRSDKLILYSVLIVALTILTCIVKVAYCRSRYKECNLRFESQPDIPFLKEMFLFAGWNMFGALCGMGRSQGLAIILNIFYGTVMNSAYGIANQLNGVLSIFSANISKALNPQIIKSHAEGDSNRTVKLAMAASKYSFLLLGLFVLPMIFETSYILELWLKTVPAHTAIFCQLILVFILINQLTVGVQTAIQSTGRIKTYQAVVGTIILLNLPLSYFLIELGLPPYSVLIGLIFIEIVSSVLRVHYLKKAFPSSSLEYLKTVVIKVLNPILVTIAICLVPYFLMDQSFLRLIVLGAISVLSYTLTAYFYALDMNDRKGLSYVLDKYIEQFRSAIRHRSILNR